MDNNSSKRLPGLKGEQNIMWKGGKSIASNGYVLIRVGTNHPLADSRGYAYEHRVVATEKIGRHLLSGEHVHHIDGDKSNNDPNNLEVLTRKEHRYRHRKHISSRRSPDDINDLISCQCGCGKTFYRFDDLGRSREYISGHNSELTITPEQILEFLGQGYSTNKEISQHFSVPLQAVQKRTLNMQKLSMIFKFKSIFYCAVQFKDKYEPKNPLIFCACGCGQSFLKFDKYQRPRQFISGHNGRK